MLLELSAALLSGGPVRDAAAQWPERRTQERETQEEVAPCRVVAGETGAPAGRTTMGACARAIQAGSGTGTWGPYEFEVERGGRVEKLWHAAALGAMPRVVACFDRPTKPAPSEVNDAFWQACHGGQRRAAEYLLARGADPNWVPGHTKKTPLEIAAALDTGRESLVAWLRAQGAGSASAS